jgi:hypothetical protein
LLFSLELFCEIRLPNSLAHAPFVQLCYAPARQIDHLANKMNRAQTRNQNQRGQINCDNEKYRTDRPESGRKKAAMFIRQAITDETARSLNVHRHFPPEQMADPPRLIETRSRDEEQNDPRDSDRHTQSRIKQFRCAESEQNRRQQ